MSVTALGCYVIPSCHLLVKGLYRERDPSVCLLADLPACFPRVSQLQTLSLCLSLKGELANEEHGKTSEVLI